METGTLYVCGTPIGNMEDITLRVLRTLKEVDIIAAEDTRQSVKLLNYYDIKTPLTSYHEHNKEAKGPRLVSMLKEGKNIAIVTDAGMPGISDPGEDLIALCYEEGIPVTVVPGATAVITALVLSGLPTRSYVFEGFLPTNKKQRREIITRIASETRTVVIYEAPHHLVDTLTELCEEMGDRYAAAVRELTKRHETVNRATLNELKAYFEENEPKGEFVVVIHGKDAQSVRAEEIASFEQMSISEHYQSYISSGMDSKSAMKQVARDRGVGKRDIYKALTESKDE
jgi:16S rRNA (cytidine1402-2'-O)-methyltransferase